MAKISEKEYERARKLASKKAGTTRAEVAEQLGVKPLRAARILDALLGTKPGALKTQEAGGARLGKQCRTLVYTVRK